MLTREEFEKETAIKTSNESGVNLIQFKTTLKGLKYGQVYKFINLEDNPNFMQRYLDLYYPLYVADMNRDKEVLVDISKINPHSLTEFLAKMNVPKDCKFVYNEFSKTVMVSFKE